MTTRLVALTLCLVASASYIQYAMEPERVPVRMPLVTLADRLGAFRGGPHTPMTKPVLDVLGVDDYVNRTYVSDTGLVGLYIGYYESQRNGDTIHSPMNCLPGAGWLPMSVSSVSIPVSNREAPIAVKRVLIQKGLDKQVVYYWYHSHGRVIGNEYWSKVYMVYDAVRLNRSDAALVRVVSPVGQSGDENRADQTAVDFVKALFTQIDEHLPL
jgi:EpsI family protein